MCCSWFMVAKWNIVRLSVLEGVRLECIFFKIKFGAWFSLRFTWLFCEQCIFHCIPSLRGLRRSQFCLVSLTCIQSVKHVFCVLCAMVCVIGSVLYSLCCLCCGLCIVVCMPWSVCCGLYVVVCLIGSTFCSQCCGLCDRFSVVCILWSLKSVYRDGNDQHHCSIIILMVYSYMCIFELLIS